MSQSPNKPDIEMLLNAANSNRSIIELDNYICELCEWGDELGNLTEEQMNFYFNQNIEREVNNGGFHQYFNNSSGDFAHQTVSSLNNIGAFKTAVILKAAIDQFPNSIVPTSQEDRRQIIAQIEENAEQVWNELDTKFFIYEDDLNTLNLQYVARYRDKF